MPETYDDQNIFAKILRGEMPCHKVYEDEYTLAFLDIMPRGKGHTLVIPKHGSRTILDIEDEALTAVIKTTKKIARAVKQAFDADGVTIHQFNERAGGQVIFHTHFHVIPRFEGIELQAHTGKMEDSEVLQKQADAISSILGSHS